VQTWHGLSNGGGVRITVARWLTPDGVWVDESGLVPEEVVSLPAEGEPFVDTQLEAAIDYFVKREATATP
jgi:carboxyl-terminal processing protease